MNKHDAHIATHVDLEKLWTQVELNFDDLMVRGLIPEFEHDFHPYIAVVKSYLQQAMQVNEVTGEVHYQAEMGDEALRVALAVPDFGAKYAALDLIERTSFAILNHTDQRTSAEWSLLASVSGQEAGLVLQVLAGTYPKLRSNRE